MLMEEKSTVTRTLRMQSARTLPWPIPQFEVALQYQVFGFTTYLRCIEMLMLYTIFNADDRRFQINFNMYLYMEMFLNTDDYTVVGLVYIGVHAVRVQHVLYVFSIKLIMMLSHC